MSNQAFPRFQARIPEELKKVIDDFLKKKNMTQAKLVEKYIPAVLISIDKDLYIELYLKYYSNKNIENYVKEMDL